MATEAMGASISASCGWDGVYVGFRCLANDLGATLDLEAVEAMAKRYGLASRQARAASGRPNELTPREREVIALLAHGYSNRAIAQELFLSHRTVEHHVRSIRMKLDCRSRTDAVRRAIELGVLAA